MRSGMFVLAFVGTLVACDRSFAVPRGEIIPQTTAMRHGLTRPWFAQVQLDRSRTRVTHMVLDAGALFVQTDQAVLHALDAETGQTLWAAEVGRRGHPSLTPAANKLYVAVVNGSFLYVVNRFNGNLLWKAELEGVPGAGAALSDDRVYVATTTGLVLSYLLEPVKDPLEELAKVDEAEPQTPEEQEARQTERRESIRLQQEYVPPLACQSYGRALVQPIVTRQTEGEQYVAWPTDRGYLFVGQLDENQERFTLHYRLQTEAGIVARPTYLPPNPNVVPDSGVVFAASRDGFVHAIEEKAGVSLWRFPSGEPILEPAVAIDQNVYVVTQTGNMYCLEAKSGTERWRSSRVDQFVAASKDRVYVADKLSRIVVLSAATGARLDSIPAPGLDLKLVNMQTDRIYLATGTGLVQCLHEAELSEPIQHLEFPEEPAAQEKPPAEPKAKQQAPPAPKSPFENPFN